MLGCVKMMYQKFGIIKIILMLLKKGSVLLTKAAFI